MATAARKTNWFAIWTAIIAAVIVVGVVISVVIANSIAGDTGTQPKGKGIESSEGAVVYGTGKDVVETYIDFQCPTCRAFEAQYGEQLQKLAKDNKITLKVKPIAILDRVSQGSRYSTRASNAYWCVAEKGGLEKAQTFATSLFDNQPDEGTTGLTDDQIAEYAKKVDVDIASCQKKLTFDKYISVMSRNLPEAEDGSKGTPTFMINGKFTPLKEIVASKTYFTDKFGK